MRGSYVFRARRERHYYESKKAGYDAGDSHLENSKDVHKCESLCALQRTIKQPSETQHEAVGQKGARKKKQTNKKASKTGLNLYDPSKNSAVPFRLIKSSQMRAVDHFVGWQLNDTVVHEKNFIY